MSSAPLESNVLKEQLPMKTHDAQAEQERRQPAAEKATHRRQGAETAVALTSRRPEFLAQRKLQQLTNASPRVQQVRAIQQAANQARPVQGYFSYGGVRQKDLLDEIASIFGGSDGFDATLQDFKRLQASHSEVKDLDEWFTEEVLKRKWQELIEKPLGHLGLSIRQFVNNYKTGFYNAQGGQAASGGMLGSMTIGEYLEEPGRHDAEMEEVDFKSVESGKRLESGELYVSMPEEMIGDMAERLVVDWLQKMRIKPQQEKNKSGHGLDVIFEITVDEIKGLPPEVQAAVFGSIVSQHSTKSKRVRKPSLKVEENAGSDRYLVVFEVKANSAQLSKAQGNSDKYIYKQSKTGFGMGVRKLIENGCAEMFFEVNVCTIPDDMEQVEFKFIRRDDVTTKGLPKSNETLNYLAEAPLDHMSSKILGDAGEKFAMEQLILRGYKSVGSLKRDGGQGVDIVAIGGDGKIYFFEVKAHLGLGKKASLSEREQRQSGFVCEILFDILGQKNGYEKVNPEILQMAWSLYSHALQHDMDQREERGEPIRGLDSVDTHRIVNDYMVDQARYFVINVDFPKLGEVGKPVGRVEPWVRPKQ